MSDEKKLKILKALKSGKITRDQATGLMDKHGISYKGSENNPEPVEQQDEQGLGSQIFDYGMRALDYTGGLTRTAIAGAADPFVEGDLVNQDDVINALKGKAVTTEEVLDRSGMEDGALRTGLGFAGDVALDPTTYMSGGISALAKLGKAGKLGKVAALAAAPSVISSELLGKAVGATAGKAYKGSRDMAMKGFGVISGADPKGVKEFVKNKETILKISENPVEFSDDVAEKYTNAMKARKDRISQSFADLDPEREIVDISQEKKKIKEALEEIEAGGFVTEDGGIGLRPEKRDLYDSLNEVYKDAFGFIDESGNIVGEIPDSVNLEEAMRIKRAIKETGSGKKTIFDKNSGQERAIKKIESGKLRSLYSDINKKVDEAYGPSAKIAREEYGSLLDDQNVIDNLLMKTSNITGERKAFDTLYEYGKTKRGKAAKRAMEKIDENISSYGINSDIGPYSSLLRASEQMIDPSWLPISSNSVVSTGRIALTAGAGAKVAEDIAPSLGSRLGAAAGMAAGALGGSPAAMKNISELGYKTENLTKKVPTSVWRRMLINQNEDQ